MNEKLDTILTELHRHFKTLYGPRLARLILYGSQARGEAEPGSDIDVMVVLEGPINPGQEIERTGEIISELSLEYDEVISCVFVSTKQFEQEQSPLLLNVRREGITINIGTMLQITRAEQFLELAERLIGPIPPLET